MFIDIKEIKEEYRKYYKEVNFTELDLKESRFLSENEKDEIRKNNYKCYLDKRCTNSFELVHYLREQKEN